MTKHICNWQRGRALRLQELVTWIRSLRPTPKYVALQDICESGAQELIGYSYQTPWTVYVLDDWLIRVGSYDTWIGWFGMHLFLNEPHLVKSIDEDSYYYRYRNYRQNRSAVAEVNVFEQSYLCLVLNSEVKGTIPGCWVVREHSFEADEPPL